MTYYQDVCIKLIMCENHPSFLNIQFSVGSQWLDNQFSFISFSHQYLQGMCID